VKEVQNRRRTESEIIKKGERKIKTRRFRIPE
jgi:hypothetical protein